MKKLMIVVLLALFATACGGSDADTETVTDSSAATQEDTSDSEQETEAPEPDDAVEPPEPLEPVAATQARDCAHSAAELGGDDEEAAPEVELPPAVKPPVDDEYLVSVDELITTDLIVGTGAEAVTGATVDMQYVGVLAEGGTEFDASWDRGQAFSFTLGGGQVIAGWDEGIVGMKVGGRRVLQIPSAQAYGDQARGAVIGANADLVFVVDLIGVGTAPEPAPEIDESNLGTFADLQITDLVEGEGCTAEIGDIVAVNYVGVDAETGEEFDSSFGRGEPFTLVVGRAQVIDGWNAGIEGMKVGGERILQIPAGQAYGDGDMVFRVHLEELTEAPLAHTLTFDGDAPDELQVTTLVEGTGDGATSNDILDVHVAVIFWNSDTIVQSTWEQGEPTQLALAGGALLPGLAESIEGVKAGEVRQIVIPESVAYPDGIPEGQGFEPGDAFVFIVEPIRISGS